MERKRAELTDEERDLLAPSAVVISPWIKPIDEYNARQRSVFSAARFG